MKMINVMMMSIILTYVKLPHDNKIKQDKFVGEQWILDEDGPDEIDILLWEILNAQRCHWYNGC